MASDAAWLVVIDMQTIFEDHDSGWAVPDFARVETQIHLLVEHFRPRVVFTRFVAPDKPAGAWADYYKLYPFALVPPDHPLYRLTKSLDDVRGDAPVVTCETFNKWGDALVNATGGAATLVMAGVATDCCVLSTALAAAEAGVHVVVVEDACASGKKEDHAQGVGVLKRLDPLVKLASSDTVVRRYA